MSDNIARNEKLSIWHHEHEICGINRHLDDFIDSVDATKICDFLMKKVDFISKVKVETKFDKIGLLGQIDFSHPIPVLSLFGEGSGCSVATLLHELAHFKVHNHSPAFFRACAEVVEAFEKYHDEIFESDKGDLHDVIEYLLDIWEEGEKITRGLIGKELSEADLNNTENLTFVISEMKELGVAV